MSTQTSEQLAIAGGPKAVSGIEQRPWPEIVQADRDAVLRVLDSGILAGAGAPEITALEREYAEYVGVQYCLATKSGTSALHCAAAAAGVQPGDEVIVPAYTFVASAMAMAHQGAQVVFADVDPRTYNLDPDRLAERITDRTTAVVAVAIHGQPASLDEIEAVAKRHGLAVIEDNAQAHGIKYKGRTAGSIGEVAGSSLNASKNLASGEGGLFTTDDEDAFIAARRLTVVGEDLVPLERRSFWAQGVGWNYRQSELPCALARAQLARLDEHNARAEANGVLLTEQLSEIRGLTPPFQEADRGCSYWKYAVQIDSSALGFDGDPRDLRDRLLAALQAEGVQCMTWQPHPVPAQPAFRRPQQTWHRRNDQEPLVEWDPAEYPVASRLCDITLSLGSEAHPLYVQEPELMDLYATAVRKVMGSIETVLSVPFQAKPRRIA
ncbi:MAG TPA: DegT/DnrJ/EryC1/StrS family aminotransferase [Solirubrobacteraceae bacterium]|jgi:dTDP-4-amino-4,6-dideoxygalactose transaminase|nr:DegT/DnrJ/EryC1/StrS family aminotransferase [Solirubrobacteraceae bacterium]